MLKLKIEKYALKNTRDDNMFHFISTQSRDHYDIMDDY